MFRTHLKIASLLIAVLCFATSVPAQGQTPAPADNYVTNSGFKNRVFDIHNRMAEDLVPVIRLLTSGFKGAQISASNEFRTITVRDFPENIAAIEEAIKRLDKAEAVRPDIELKMHVLLASNKETLLTPIPAELRDVIGELQKTLNYKDYYLLTSIVQRTRESRSERPGYLQGKGSADIGWPNAAVVGGIDRRLATYQFDANTVTLTSNPSGVGEVRLGSFTFYLSIPGNEARIHSDLSIREGEKVVVGTAGFSDKALIVVMTARVLK